MAQFFLIVTALVMFVMGVLCLHYLRDRRERPSESFLKNYVLLFSLLLLGFGMSMAAMADRYQGAGLYQAVFAVIIAGSFMLIFPGRFKSLLASIIENCSPFWARTIALFNAMLCFFCGAALIYLAMR